MSRSGLIGPAGWRVGHESMMLCSRRVRVVSDRCNSRSQCLQMQTEVRADGMEQSAVVAGWTLPPWHPESPRASAGGNGPVGPSIRPYSRTFTQ